MIKILSIYFSSPDIFHPRSAKQIRTLGKISNQILRSTHFLPNSNIMNPHSSIISKIYKPNSTNWMVLISLKNSPI